uniref:Uncharacterized protein n=1 Tax=Panagrolaimus sp. ES5 TaxID=591445 RepID=A0AC34F3T5_9BILA
MAGLKRYFFTDKIDNQCIAMITNHNDHFSITTLDCRTNELILINEIITASPKDFVDNIDSIFGNKGFKAIFFNIFKLKSPEFSNNLELCKIIKSKFNKLNIECYFMTNMGYIITCFLIASKITVKEGEEVVVFTMIDKLLNVSRFCYTKNGYKLVKQVGIEIDEENAEINREKIFENSNPKHVIFFQDSAKNQKTTKFLHDSIFVKNDNLIKVDFNLLAEIEKKFLTEMLKWLNDKTFTKFHVIPFNVEKFCQFIKIGNKLCNRSMDLRFALLPLIKKKYVPSLDLEYSVGYIGDSTEENVILEKIPFKKECHKHEIILSIDDQHFLDIQKKPIMLEEICKFPSYLNKNMKEVKVPVIGFFDFSSVICYHNDNKNGYEFVEKWNGLYGKPLFISFDKEKPHYCESAFEVYKEKPNFVVSHLIDIISQGPEIINYKNDTCGFTLTKDSENPILLEFDTFVGIKKMATPTFLMALMLKEHLKVIKAETGEKPKSLGFYLFDKFDPDAKERIEKSLEESCKLLKIGFEMVQF